MVDQVNPMGGLATGLLPALLAVVTPRPAPEKARPTQSPETKTSKPDEPSSAKSGDTPDVAVERLNSYLQQTNTQLKLRVDQDSGRTVIQIKKANGEVLLQVPSEELLAMARKLRTLAEQMGTSTTSGVLLDKQG